eukprot:2619945-Amphidinium_carterae.1
MNMCTMASLHEHSKTSDDFFKGVDFVRGGREHHKQRQLVWVVCIHVLLPRRMHMLVRALHHHSPHTGTALWLLLAPALIPSATADACGPHTTMS